MGLGRYALGVQAGDRGLVTEGIVRRGGAGPNGECQRSCGKRKGFGPEAMGDTDLWTCVNERVYGEPSLYTQISTLCVDVFNILNLMLENN
jgi:hypothetical protein